MIVHFICTGNSYRSRLAEAYFNSKQLPNIKAISSGINPDKFISWITLRIIQQNGLSDYVSSSCQKTIKKLIQKSDFVVFFEDKHYEFCKNLGFSSKNFEIWNIHDLSPEMTEREKIEKSEETFEEIKKKIDKLLAKSTFTGRVE
mgnify:CR=1 FL=1